MRLCQELAELGMQLARFAAARAMQDLAAQPAPEQPSPNAATLFTRLSHAVRQAILLENRIAAELEKAGTAKPAPPPDDRRRTLRRLLHCAATTRPDGSDFKRIAHERLDIELALDPHASTGDILATICETLGEKLLARGEELEALAGGAREGLAMLDGWRLEAFGRDALELVEGRVGFTVKDGRMVMGAI